MLKIRTFSGSALVLCTIAAITFFAGTACMSLPQAARVLDPAPGQGNEYTYTITTVIKVLKPCTPAVMNDIYQDVRILEQDKNSYTLEVTYYPLNDAVRKKREAEYAKRPGDDPSLYLASTATCNWDQGMRADLITALHNDGINPQLLTDVQLVEQVTRWALNRSAYISSDGMPIAWYVNFRDGQPNVAPSLRSQFDAEKPSSEYTDRQMLEGQVLGRSMFYGKTHGACTSSAIYLATILRALGIPTRILYFIPPCDGNDPRQVAMLTSAIHEHAIEQDEEEGLTSCRGFCNHMYNEVFIGGRWIRLNYDTLGQNIVDRNYFGLLAHIDTCRDIDETNLAGTWGKRSAEWPKVAVPMTSINPYMLIQAWDHFGKYVSIDNPQTPQLTKVTINGVYWRNTPQFNELVTGPANEAPDLLIDIADWLPSQDYHQLRDYMAKASNRFILHAAGHPDLRVQLTGLDCNNASARGFGANITDADRSSIAPGAVYTIEPVNTNSTYRWSVGSGVSLAIPNN